MTRANADMPQNGANSSRRAIVGCMAASILLWGRLEASAAGSGEADLAQRLMEASPGGADRSLGREDAKVKLIEYGSVTSAACADFHVNVLPAILDRYVITGEVRYIFREYPLDQSALMVFMLTRCIPEARYFSTLDMIFQRQKLWNGENIKPELLKIMESAGMSESDFIACLQRKDLAQALYETRRKARDEFGVEDTPTLFVNGRKVDSHESVAAVTAVIETVLGEG